ncbi:MAG TPA: selenocysteine-specific translation elongation factor, partial [Desulfobacterales bacterium]|nr:selenocysteine-specific translation elongation factor [Desulfobacterales bacterium]
EKERGITIELGFAHLELPGGKLVGIVDVPGHEKFVKNMVAGATGIDLVALVIAADEGIMPQTQEHLEICQLLGIRHGLVVLTKIDMVDEEWLELVKEDVKEYLAGTFLDDAPMVEVSSATGEGLDRLLQVLDKLVQELPQKEVGHIFRLPIDRVFVIKGFGTVVTGTTVSGKVSLGDEVTIYPEQIQSRVRGIQVHGKEVEEVRAGLRTAINLQGLEKSMIKRGDVVASAGALRSTFMVDVTLELLESAPRKLKNRAKARFHVGTAEIISTVVLLDREELSPGEKCFAQLRLERPTAVLRGDKYVLRSYSPVRTIGGGKVLNPLPKKMKRFSEQRQKELQVLDGQDLEAIIETFVQMGGFQGIGVEELRFLTDLSTSKLEAHLRGLKSKGHL